MADAAARRSVSSSLLVGLGALAAAGNLAAGGGLPGVSPGAALLAMAALLQALRQAPSGEADARDWACFTAALALAAAPARPGALAALLLLALPCLRRRGEAGGMGLLLLATGGLGLFGLLGAGMAAAPVMQAEAQLVASLLRLGGTAAEATGNLVSMPETRQALLILRGCSVLVLLPEVAVVTLALAQLLRPGAPVWQAVGLAAVAATLLNLARLVAMALSRPVAEALHTDWGLAGLQLAWTALALGATLLTVRRG